MPTVQRMPSSPGPESGQFSPHRDEPGWMKKLRAECMENFLTMSWPTAEQEEWRRTDLSGIDFKNYPKPFPPRDNPPLYHVSPEFCSGIISFRNSFCVNRKLDEAYEKKGVYLASLQDALRLKGQKNMPGFLPGFLQTCFEKYAHAADNRFLAWHYGAWTHGAVLYVPPFTEIEYPFYINFTVPGEKLMQAPHLFIILDKGARAGVFHRILNRNQGEVLCNSAANMFLSDSSKLEYVNIQSLNNASKHFQFDSASIGRDADLRRFDMMLGGELSKTRWEAWLHGSGAEASLSGIYFCEGRQHKDSTVLQKHCAPHTASRSFYKGGVSGEGRSVFQGLIDVWPEAAGTDAYLSNRNLVLNQGSQADSIPSLNIKTNDVKCSHDSTTGKIDPEKLFYLMSRGFPERSAKAMLVQAFFDEVIRESPEFAKNQLGATMQRFLEKTVYKEVFLE